MAQLVLPSQVRGRGRGPMTTPTPAGGGLPLAYGPGVPARIEQLINAFARWVGYRPVAVDGQIDPVDAADVVSLQRWLFQRPGQDAGAVRRLERELEECAQVAELAQGRDGIERTPEQVWVARHQRAIIAKLPLVFQRLTTGAR